MRTIRLLTNFFFLLIPLHALPQPIAIPGDFTITAQPFPALDDIIGKPDPALPVYGLYAGTSEFRMYLAQIKDVGWKSVRLGGTLSDVEMLFICQNNIEIMKTLDGFKRDDEASDDEFLAKELAFYRDQVRRYGPDGTFFTDRPTLPQVPVRHWEIRNEPNFQYMYEAGTEAEREALYARLLPMAYDTIKHYSPTSEVVGFGAGGSSHGDVRFIQHVHENNTRVATSYDVLSTHPYLHNVPPETDCHRTWGSYSGARSLAEIRALLTTHNAATDRIWYTEVGWRISREEGGTFPSDTARDVTQRLQAAYVCRQYALALRLGVERVHIMYITDADNFNGAFFNPDRSYRESAVAVKNMIKLMPHPKIMSAFNDGAQGYYAYQFNPDVQVDFTVPVIMAWNVAGPMNAELPVADGDYRVYDMLGDTATVTAAGGRLAVEVGPCPLYVIKEGASGIRQEGDNSKLTDLQVTQNPFSGRIKFIFSVAAQTDVRLDIFDMNGKVRHAGLYKYVRPGEKAITWDTSREKAPAGPYVYCFTHQGSQRTGKLINLK